MFCFFFLLHHRKSIWNQEKEYWSVGVFTCVCSSSCFLVFVFSSEIQHVEISWCTQLLSNSLHFQSADSGDFCPSNPACMICILTVSYEVFMIHYWYVKSLVCQGFYFITMEKILWLSTTFVFPSSWCSCSLLISSFTCNGASLNSIQHFCECKTSHPSLFLSVYPFDYGFKSKCWIFKLNT